MYKHLASVFTAIFAAIQGLLFFISVAQAQSTILDLPRASQHAVVTQRIGITDVSINYHRPLVNKRKIWGGVVPYGDVWRAGANENTTIAFSDPVSVEGKTLPKGAYGLHMIPGENEWTVIFSRNSTSWGSFTYDQKEDALRVAVKPQPAEFHEALTYDFDDVKPDSSTVTLRWEKIAVPFKVAVNLNDVVQQSLNQQLRGLGQYTWFGWDDAATYLVDNKGNLDEALKYSNNSIQNEERYENLFTKSRILDAMGRKDEANATKNKALGKANAIQLHTYARQRGVHQQGTVFKITPGGTLTTLGKFRGIRGTRPEAPLIQVSDGSFYGTTAEGGASGWGTVFKMTPGGALTTLHSFHVRDGARPNAPLTQAIDGNFYGTTFSGSTYNGGTIFKMTPGGALTTLHIFDVTNSAYPVAGLVEATDGTFYGTTVGGTGTQCDLGCGTVFSLDAGLGPFVEALPASGKVGAKVIILGTNLTGTTDVSFNGTPATFNVVSGSEIKTAVPTGATTGKITVITPGGTLSSNLDFRVRP